MMTLERYIFIYIYLVPIKVPQKMVLIKPNEACGTWKLVIRVVGKLGDRYILLN